MRITAVLEGPISSDGEGYFHAKGERLYLDNLAENVEKLTLVTYVFRPEHVDYASASHSPFESQNLFIVELPFDPEKKYNPLGKLCHFISVFGKIWRSSHDVDLYYFFVPSYPSAMAWLINKFRRRPYILYAASDWEEISSYLFKWHSTKYRLFFPLVKWVNGILERQIAKGALFCVTAGTALRKKYEHFSRYVHETTPRIAVSKEDIFHRIDTCTGDHIKIICVGDLIARKNLEMLIRAVARYRDRNRNRNRITVLLVGVGPMEDELRMLSKDLDLESEVVFKGYVREDSELNALYREADIYTLTSRSEGFPRVLYEAMSQSVPIITTNCGGITGLIRNRENALVVDVDDCEGLVSALECMVSDGDLRRSIMEQARQTISKVLDRTDPVQIPRLINQYLSSPDGKAV